MVGLNLRIARPVCPKAFEKADPVASSRTDFLGLGLNVLLEYLRANCHVSHVVMKGVNARYHDGNCQDILFESVPVRLSRYPWKQGVCLASKIVFNLSSVILTQ